MGPPAAIAAVATWLLPVVVGSPPTAQLAPATSVGLSTPATETLRPVSAPGPEAAAGVPIRTPSRSSIAEGRPGIGAQPTTDDGRRLPEQTRIVAEVGVTDHQGDDLRVCVQHLPLIADGCTVSVDVFGGLRPR